MSQVLDANPTPRPVMASLRVPILIAVLMIISSVASVALRPSKKAADIGPPILLEAMIPEKFGEWREQPQSTTTVINPQTKELLDKLYSQVLTRIYVNNDGYQIMLSLAYGSDQRGSLQAHKPEVCYPAQGFTLVSNETLPVQTAFGPIPAQRLFTTHGQRKEPVTYWFASGDTVVQGKLEKRLVDLRFGLTGQIPDGLIFRVSSIDPDQKRANQLHDQFVDQLLRTISATDRKRLSGLDATEPPRPQG